MKLRAKARLFLLAPLAVFLCGPAAHACMCARVSPCESASGASLVFVGRVEQVFVENVKSRPSPEAEVVTFGGGVTRLRVEETLLGEAGGQVEIRAGGTTCDFHFRVGGRYLVYASAGDDGKTYGTSTCSGTKSFDNAGEDLAYLRGAEARAAGATFSGEVSREVRHADERELTSEPQAGVEVIFEGAGGRRFSARTDALGQYEVRGLPPGRYRVRTDPPTNDSNAPFYGGGEGDRLKEEPRAEWEVEAPPHGCHRVWFSARYEGEISGAVTAADGPLPDDIEVSLRPADGEMSDHFRLAVKPDEKGRFTFHFLPPARYYLGFNLGDGPTLGSPYPKFYFPGTTSRAAAQPVTLGAGEKVRGLSLPVPARLAEVTVAGVAVWPDGRPAANTTVELNNPATGSNEGNGVTTDAEGRFALPAVEGQTYDLRAVVQKGTSLIDSQPLRLTARARLKPVRLVVRLPE